MRRVVIVGLILAGVVAVAVAAGYWLERHNAAGPVALPTSCHPPLADMTPDGGKFVALTTDGLEITVSFLKSDENVRVIRLTRPARDIVAVDEQTLLVSHGESGQVALISLEEDRPEALIKVGGFAGELCKGSLKQVFIADPANGRIYRFDPAAKRVVSTYPVKGQPSRMRWQVPGKQLEVFSDNGEPLAVLDIGKKPPG